MIYGIRSVMEALEAGHDLEKVFIQKNLKGDLVKALYAALGQSGSPVSSVPPEKLNRFTGKNHQGVVAFLSPVKYHDTANLVAAAFEAGKVPFILMLDRVTDVRNFGAIARTAESMGVDAIIIPSRNAAQINSDAIKTSAGALASLPVCRVENLANQLKELKNSGFHVVACSEKGVKPIHEATLTDPLVLVLGSEEDGISPELLRIADEISLVPMRGVIASLNVSAAAAMFVYEAARQRG